MINRFSSMTKTMGPSWLRLLRLQRLIIWAFCCTSIVVYAKDSNAFLKFLKDCTNGNYQGVKRGIREHPSWVNKESTDIGETCLHLAGLDGHDEITQLLLDNGADPNVRTNRENGLRMHALGWHVIGGHLDAARILLQHGADPNLDVDSREDPNQKTTVLDHLYSILELHDPDNTSRDFDNYRQMVDLLLSHGAKRYSDLQEEL